VKGRRRLPAARPDGRTGGGNNDWPPFFAVFQPAIHLVWDGLGAAADFASGGFVHNFFI